MGAVRIKMPRILITCMYVHSTVDPNPFARKLPVIRMSHLHCSESFDQGLFLYIHSPIISFKVPHTEIDIYGVYSRIQNWLGGLK